LRAHAVAQSLFRPTTLKEAIDRLGFVQADPIRSPARAQDLILRHRVRDYRAGDLEEKYPALDVEEDLLYAYGFLPRNVWSLLHPRRVSRLTALEKKVLDTVRRTKGAMHPRDLEAHFGRKRVVNAWGGWSKATTRALDHLHHRGLLRIAGRDAGIRVYEPAPPPDETFSPRERFRRLMLVIARLLAPVRQRTIQSIATRVGRWLGGGIDHRREIRDLELERAKIDCVDWLWPPAKLETEHTAVRFLAPFDPIVWDRARFEQLWGWTYRFEAYTPVAKRVRGYYAMPMLWRDAIIGWANASVIRDRLRVDVGFVGKRPRDAEFRSELAAEIGRMETFLSVSRKNPTSPR